MRLDLRGVALVVAAVAALVLPLVEGREHGWPLWTWVSFALVPVLAAGTVGTYARAPGAAAPSSSTSPCSGRTVSRWVR